VLLLEWFCNYVVVGGTVKCVEEFSPDKESSCVVRRHDEGGEIIGREGCGWRSGVGMNVSSQYNKL
jgi:hypothetical protein